ncbi:hypothetical protein EC973_004816 [Apophysomyces ossiformis]|uniref:Pyrroloquinoline quinone-dependent pyranose dehydrogenase beta-propeller domain-containing protein n=1 Tax=Apophysomyces ossiformis TaxID=679940 RepID=A0A8H7EKD3_9FUNG|nr:hypothetical protein EC973_004816 [Apophysomyces ossiformis]
MYLKRILLLTAFIIPSHGRSGSGNELMNANPDSATGGIRMGSTNALVPDASAEHPMVISRPEDQPLCKPDHMIQPSKPIKVMDGFNAIVLANVKNPRKMVVDHVDHILVVSGGEGVYSIRTDKCGNVDVKSILTELDQPVSHGIALYNNHVYVATANSVWKFPYVDGQHSPLENGVKVLTDINPTNPHARPDIAIDPFGHAYIPRSVQELDDRVDAKQAVIKKFNFRVVPDGGYHFDQDGEVHAYGTNSHGTLAFDAQARLWGIDAPFDTVQRADINGDIAQRGLAEEINLYEFPSKNYGFPYCFTEFDLKPFTPRARGKGAQWGHPIYMNESLDLDHYCQQENYNQAPAVPLAPQSYASALFFYMGTFCSVGDTDTRGTSVGMPCNWTDTPIVAYHGAIGQPSGHSVVHLPFDDLGHKPRWDKQVEVILEGAEPCTEAPCISPTGLAIDSFGRLLVSSDETNEIFMVNRIYNPQAAKILTDRDNAKEAAEEAAEEAKEEEEDNDDGEEEGEEEKDNNASKLGRGNGEDKQEVKMKSKPKIQNIYNN